MFEELEKSRQRKSQSKIFLFFFQIDGSEQCGTQNNVQHCRVACTVTWTAVVGGKRHLRLGFVFPTEKSSTPSFGCSGFVFAVFCHRLTATSRMPDLATIHVYNGETSEAAANVQLSIVRLSNLTKRKSSWKLKTHSDPCDL